MSWPSKRTHITCGLYMQNMVVDLPPPEPPTMAVTELCGNLPETLIKTIRPRRVWWRKADVVQHPLLHTSGGGLTASRWDKIGFHLKHGEHALGRADAFPELVQCAVQHLMFIVHPAGVQLEGGRLASGKVVLLRHDAVPVKA